MQIGHPIDLRTLPDRFIPWGEASLTRSRQEVIHATTDGLFPIKRPAR